MNPKIEAIKNEVREILRIISERGQPLTPEMKQQLNQVLQHAERRIGELRKEEEQQQPPSPEPQASQEPFQGQPGQPQAAPQVQGAPPSPDAQLLWILAGQQEDAFVNYLQTYPTAATQQLLSNPEELQRVIQYLHRMMPSGTPPTINGIQHADLNSSNIWGTAYDPKSGKMRVRFQGGSEYEYEGVPANIYRAFTNGQASARTNGQNQYGRWWVGKNPSLGAAMNQYIKAGNFSYRRLR